jgi:hypothetical protein
VSIFETRSQRDARLNRLAQHNESPPEVQKSVIVDDNSNDKWKIVKSEKALATQAGNEGQRMNRTEANENAIKTSFVSSPANNTLVPADVHTSTVGGTELKEHQLAPDFAMYKEEQPLPVLKTGDGVCVPSTLPPSIVTPDRGIADTVERPTWAAFARQVEINDEQGHRRRRSSLNATAIPFRGQTVLSPLAATACSPRPPVPRSESHHQRQHGRRPDPAPRGRGTHPTACPPRYQPAPTLPNQPMGAFSVTTRPFRPPLPPTTSATSIPTADAGRGAAAAGRGRAKASEMGSAIRGRGRGRGRGTFSSQRQPHASTTPVVAQAQTQQQPQPHHPNWMNTSQTPGSTSAARGRGQGRGAGRGRGQGLPPVFSTPRATAPPTLAAAQRR